MDVLTCEIHKALTLTCFTIVLLLLYNKEDTPYMQSFILSKGLPLQLFPNLLSERVSLNVVTVMGAEN